MSQQNSRQQKGKPPKPTQQQQPQNPPRGRRRRNRRRLPLTKQARSQVRFAKGMSYDSLAQVIALPHEKAPVRFPQGGTSVKSNLFKLFGNAVLAHQPLAGDDQKFSPIVLAASPIHPFWTLQNTGLQNWYTSTWGLTSTANEANQLTLQPEDFTLLTYTTQYANFPQPATCRKAKYDNAFMYYLPQGSEMTYAFTGLTATSVTVALHSYKFGLADTQLVLTGTPSGSALSLTFTSQTNQWVYLAEIRGNAAIASTSMSLQVSGRIATTSVRTLLPAFPMIEKDALSTFMNDARCTAAAVLLKNTTNRYYQGGVWNAAKLPANRFNPFALESMAAMVASRNATDRYVGKGELGLYTFAVPTEETMNFNNYELPWPGQVGPNGLVRLVLDDFAMANVAYYTGSNVSPITSGIAQEFEIQFDTHIETRNNSQLFLLGVPTIPLQVYQDLLAATSVVCPFTENPAHMAALAALVSRLFKQAAPYLAPMARRGLRMAYQRIDDHLATY